MEKSEIKNVINGFENSDLTQASIDFLKTIGLQSSKQMPLAEKTYDEFISLFNQKNLTFNTSKAFVSDWLYIDFLFQITSDELKDLSKNEVDKNCAASYLFFCIELKNAEYSRTALSQITREINKLFLMPVLIIFKTGDNITLSIIDRRPNKRDETKDVLEKITFIKDINIKIPHRAHIDILYDLSFEQIKKAKLTLNNFSDLHEAYQKVLDTEKLYERFYKELSEWYYWAIQNVKFPDDIEKNEEVRNSTNLIRLITRVIFIWFIKEKGLVPNNLFSDDYLKDMVKDFNKDETSKNYYNAILQNLFFGTLNQKIEERKFAKDGDLDTNKDEYGIKNLYRYSNMFKSKAENEIKKLFETVPFLNGGLFDCLDKENEGGKVKYVDGFSRNSKKQAKIPDFLFFGSEQNVDLNKIYNTKGKTYKSKGLINILNSYKFTIAENTPTEEDVALDPELLGMVFEELLASYNPETRVTARNQTGSFYTPREIVDYMVNESLIAYLKTQFLSTDAFLPLGRSQIELFGNETRTQGVIGHNANEWIGKENELEDELRNLLNTETESVFAKNNKKELISALNNIKILDPACGSGAFPMGILHKMVEILQKLDPDNTEWRKLQEYKASSEAKDAFKIENQKERENRLKEISDIFENNSSDYGRKLFLIENCIFGVDKQSIAVQISKLRFFISLIIDQKTDKTKENLGVRSLPNLETKFVAADALIGFEENNNAFSNAPDITNKKEELKSVRQEYFTVNNRQAKLSLQEKDRKIRKELSEMLKVYRFDEKSADNIAKFDPYNQSTNAEWFDAEWMFGLSHGFDVVIGNPPYIQLQNNGGELANLYKNSKYKTFARTGDIYCLFYERGHQLLKSQGTLCYITSNKWMRAGYGESTRKFFAENTNPERLIDFAGVKVFKSATVDTNILMFSKDKNRQKTQASIVKKEGIKDFSDYIRQNSIACGFKTGESWVILSPIEQSIKAKIEAVGVPLRDWDINIYRGILTGYNEAFIIDGNKKKELIEQDPKSAEIIRPILRGRDIKKYSYEFADLWLINTHNGIREKGIKPIDVNDYPAIKRHLDNYYNELEKRQDKGETPYNLRNCAYTEDFSKQKILWAETMRIHKSDITNFPRFGFATADFFTDKTCFFATGSHLHYILAYLNSSIGRYLCKRYVSILDNGGYLMQKIYLESIPIVKPTDTQIQDIEFICPKNADWQTSKSDLVINEKIYALYNFSQSEIEYIANDNFEPLSR